MTDEILDLYREYYKNVYTIDDYQNGIVEMLIAKENLKEPFTDLIAMYEPDLTRAGNIRDVYGLKGQSYKSALAFCNKLIMKKTAVTHDIKTPKFQSLCSPIDLIAFQKDVGLPFILKPAQGAGSVGIKILNTMEDIYNCMDGLPENLIDGEYIMEELIIGKVYHINGIVHNNKVLLSWPSVSLNSCLDMVQNKLTYGWHLLSNQNKLVKRLNAFAEKIIKAFPSPENFVYHLEVFVDKGGGLLLNEIASRPGGAGCNEDWIEAFGVDLYKDFVRLQAGTYVPDIKRKVPEKIYEWILFPKTNGVVTKVPTQEPPFDWLIRKYTCVNLGEQTKDPVSILDFAFRGQIEAADEKDFNNKADILLKWLQNNFKLSNLNTTKFRHL